LRDFQSEQDFHQENYGHWGEIADIQDRVQSWMVQVDLRLILGSGNPLYSSTSIIEFLRRTKNFSVLAVVKITGVASRLRGHLKYT
jgi:hypothetical protein